MRGASPNTLDSLSQTTGTEPVVVLQLNFGGGLEYFSTKSITFQNGAWLNARIIDIGELVHTRRQDNFANTSSISITLDDSDNRFKFIFDATRTEKAPAAVYLHYPDNAFEDMMLLIKGEIIGPVSWDEGQRSVTFNIEARTDHSEFGFSPTKDDFPDLSDDAVGVPWPVAFGEVAHVPAVHVKRRTEGTLITDIRLESLIYTLKVDKNGLPIDLVMDKNPHLKTFFPRYGVASTTEDTDAIYIYGGERFPQNKNIRITIEGVIFEGSFTEDTQNTPTNKFTIRKDKAGNTIGINVSRYKDVNIGARQDPNETTTDVNGNVINRTDKNGNIIKIKQYDTLWLADADKDKTLANHWVYIKTPSNKDEWFNYCSEQDKTQCTFKYPFTDPNNKYTPTLMTKLQSISGVYAIPRNGYQLDIIKTIERLRLACKANTPAQGQSAFGLINNALTELRSNSAGFWQQPADTIVRLYSILDDNDQETLDPDIYICNLAPVSFIISVYGRRELYGKKVFVPIPETYYTIVSSNYQIKGSFVTALLFNTPLEDYKDQKWDEGVYVSMHCSIGPNISDILKWIVQRYTQYTPDPSSFDKVRAEFQHFDISAGVVNRYPANFAVYERRDAIKVAQEIAWQARCAIVIDSDIVYLKHLAKSEFPVAIFNTSNIEFKSLILSYTDTSEVTTKMIGIWTDSYKDFPKPTRHNEKITTEIKELVRTLTKQHGKEREATQYLVYRENIDIFGNIPREERIYVFNTDKNVWQTLKFWGHRFANVWRRVRFKTFMNGLLIQPFDVIEIVTPQFSTGNAIVEAVRFNYKNYEVSIECFVPMLAGEIIDNQDYFVDN